MTNFEKYKDEILALVEKRKGFALRNDNKIFACIGNSCNECKFLNGENGCINTMIKWLYEDVKPTLTVEERGFCKAVERGYVARDEDGRICFYQKAPNKKKGVWYTGIGEIIEINNTYFPFITWKDSEPWSIGELLGLEVE